MSSDKKDSSKKEYPFVDKFDISQKHPLFRSEEESNKFIFNKIPIKHNEYPTNEQQTAMQRYESNEYRI